MDTIFALSSAAGKAGIAVIRLSGSLALPIAKTFTGLDLVDRIATACAFRARDGELLDRGIAIAFFSPRSFTGETVVEFQCHGSPAVVRALLSALSAEPGCRQAKPGEFTRRAVTNAKMELMAAEGLADLLDAETNAQRRQALQNMNSRLHARICEWQALILDAHSLLEASIDFSDEDDVQRHMSQTALTVLTPLKEQITALLTQANDGEVLRRGFRIALAGAPNAGKSSLLNALADRDVAIVTAIPGTTRDVIEISTEIAGFPFVFIDTAGIRETDDTLEAIGISRSRQIADSADLVLWLYDGEARDIDAVLKAGTAPIWKVRSKSDLLPIKINVPDILISVKTSLGLDDLKSRLVDYANAHSGSRHDTVLLRPRHMDALETAKVYLQAGMDAVFNDQMEIAAEELRLAHSALGQVVGLATPDDVLGKIFQRFCIGK